MWNTRGRLWEGTIKHMLTRILSAWSTTRSVFEDHTTSNQISLHHIITILPAGSLENKLSKRVTLPRVQAELFSALGAGASVAGKAVLPMSTVILRDLFCLQEVSKLPNKLTCDFETDRSQSLQNQYTEIIGWQGANSGNGDFSIRYELLWYTFNHRLSQIIKSSLRLRISLCIVLQCCAFGITSKHYSDVSSQ